MLLTQTKTTEVGTPHICFLSKDSIKRGRWAQSHLHIHHITELSECQSVQELASVFTCILDHRVSHAMCRTIPVSNQQKLRGSAQCCVHPGSDQQCTSPQLSWSHDAVSIPGCPESCRHSTRGSIMVIRGGVTYNGRKKGWQMWPYVEIRPNKAQLLQAQLFTWVRYTWPSSIAKILFLTP